MRGTVILKKDNDPTMGRIVTSVGKQLDIYKLPRTCVVGEKIKFDIRVSCVGNEYAIYLESYNQINVVVNTINYEKRMTSMEHLALYYYKLIKESRRVSYSDKEYSEWLMTEELIESYNAESDDAKMDVAEACNQSFDLFNDKFMVERWKYEKPVIWKDRKKTSYYIKQLIDSHRFEVFVDNLFEENGYDIGLYYGRDQQYSGETRAGIEIKLDKKLKDTQNVYIEYQERLHRNGIWVNSGILKEDNTKLIFIGDIDKYFILRKERLLEYYERLVINKEQIEGIRIVREVEHGTSKGFIMNEQIAIRENRSILEAINELREG